MKFLIKFPIGIVGTSLALCTLSSFYLYAGFSFIYMIAYLVGICVFLFFTFKIIFDFKVVKNHYLNNPVTAALYTTYSMLLISISSFVVHYNLFLGRFLWFSGIIIHLLLICIFFYVFILKAKLMNRILPSWYVTFMGILIAVAVGDNIGFDNLQIIITIYGFIIYFLTIPLIIYHLRKNYLLVEDKYTKVILLASISLLIISYLKVIYPLNQNFSTTILLILVSILCVNYFYIISQLKSLSSGDFMPIYAALTFPTAVTTTAVYNLYLFLNTTHLLVFTNFIYQLYGVLVLIATSIIIFVLFEFIKRFKSL